jgi:hypothetical protein
MFQKLASPIGPLARMAAPLVLVAATLALAQPAAATDWCVNTACGGTPISTFEGALIAAAQWPDTDRIFLGPKLYTATGGGGFNYSGQGPVEIIGSGEGQTILTGPSPMYGLLNLSGGAGSGVRDLSLQLGQMVAGNAGVNLWGGTATRIAVTESPAQTNPHFGVWLAGGATLAGSSVALGSSADATGVYFPSAGGTVRDSTVSADWAVTGEHGGLIERSSLTGWTTAFRVQGGVNIIRNSVVKVNAASGSGLSVVPLNGTSPTLDADGLTMTAGFAGAGTAIYGGADNSPGETVAVSVRNSVIRGYTSVLSASSFGAGKSSVAASWSDYDPKRVVVSGAPNATITQSNISNVANPGFVNPILGNYHLGASSPLIDAGDPATTQGADMDGNPLVTDGNHDGVARRDIGAFEVDGPLPVEPPAPAADTHPDSGGDQSAAPTSGPADTQAPVISGVGFSKKTFAVGRARTAIAALARGTKLRYTLSEAAKVTVAIRRLRGRAAGKLTRSGVKGANTIKFSGRIGKRALKPGRYRAVLTATDATGNRSTSHSIRFRIVHV